MWCVMGPRCSLQGVGSIKWVPKCCVLPWGCPPNALLLPHFGLLNLQPKFGLYDNLFETTARIQTTCINKSESTRAHGLSLVILLSLSLHEKSCTHAIVRRVAGAHACQAKRKNDCRMRPVPTPSALPPAPPTPTPPPSADCPRCAPVAARARARTTPRHTCR